MTARHATALAAATTLTVAAVTRATDGVRVTLTHEPRDALGERILAAKLIGHLRLSAAEYSAMLARVVEAKPPT